jgi:hypothetical protein
MINELEKLARAATPQDFDSAATKDEGGFVECPACGGEGSVEIEADYCNYDNTAIGVQFYGVGREFRAAEAYYRAANPATMLKLCEIIRELAFLVDCVVEDATEFETDWNKDARAALALATKLGVGNLQPDVSRPNNGEQSCDSWGVLTDETRTALAKANELGVG